MHPVLAPSRFVTMPLHLSLVSEPTSSLSITLPLTLHISLAPARPMPTTGLGIQLAESALTAGILSMGMAACVTSVVLTSQGIARRALLASVCRRVSDSILLSTAPSTTTTPRSLQVPKQ